MILIRETEKRFTTEKSSTKMPFAIYECPSCNTQAEANMYTVKRNKSGLCKSCMLIERNTKHGLKDHKLYGTWKAEHVRCYNENSPSYKNYGGRGIIMSDEFKDFQVWLTYIESLDNYGVEGYTLDRKDNDGNYECGNLRWATYSEQAFNRRIMSHNTSGENNICIEKSGNFLVQVQVNGKQKKIGRYTTLEEAVAARNNYKGV